MPRQYVRLFITLDRRILPSSNTLQLSPLTSFQSNLKKRFSHICIITIVYYYKELHSSPPESADKTPTLSMKLSFFKRLLSNAGGSYIDITINLWSPGAAAPYNCLHMFPHLVLLKTSSELHFSSSTSYPTSSTFPHNTWLCLFG